MATDTKATDETAGEATTPAIPTDDFGIPLIARHPKLVAAKERLAELRAELAGAEKRVTDLSRQLGLAPDLNARAVKARAMLAGKAEGLLPRFEELDRLKETHVILADAVALAEGVVDAAYKEAAKEYTRYAMGAVYQPSRRRVALAYLQFLNAVQDHMDVVIRGERLGVTNGWSIFTPPTGPRDCLETVRWLVIDGSLTREEVDANPSTRHYFAGIPVGMPLR